MISTCRNFRPVQGSETYNLDEVEGEIINQQSSRPKCNKSGMNEKNTKRRRRRSDGRVFPPKLTERSNSYTSRGRASDRKKTHRNPKSFRDAQMPPWLARYENENFAAPNYPRKKSQSTSDIKPTERDISNMQRLHLALNGIFSQPQKNVPEIIRPYSTSEIHDIMDAIRVASHENTNLMAGCADFLYLMLTLEEEGVLISEPLNREPWDDDDISNGYLDWENRPERCDGAEPFSIMTRDVLVAAAFHYCDCVRARKAGVYDYARQTMEASLDMSVWKEPEIEKRKQLALPSRLDDLDGLDIYSESHVKQDVDRKGSQDSATSYNMAVGTNRYTQQGNSSIDYYGDESVKIVADATRLKRAEIMATTINSNGSLISSGATSKSKVDAEILRTFLVSLSEDWRALVLRSAACLYRLKGITDDLNFVQKSLGDDCTNASTGSATLTRSTNVVARDAFKVYAPLAQRLGMQRLKSEIENKAFRILYPR